MAAAAQGMTFGEALKRVRMDYGYSHAKVAVLIGKSKDVIKEWENGESFPVGRDIARLKGNMPKIQPWMSLIPRMPKRLGELTDIQIDQVVDALVPPEPPPELPTHPAPKTFGAWLAMERLSEGVDQEELGELLGVTGQAVSAWETEKAVPVKENYDRLLALFPALVRAPEPEWRDIPKPDGGAGIPRNEGNLHATGPRKFEVPIPAPSTWRDRVNHITSRMPGHLADGIQSALVDVVDKDQAVAELDALIAAAQKAKKAILGGIEVIPPKPEPERPPELPGAVGAAARWGHALLRVEIAGAYVVKLEAKLETAKEEHTRAVSEEERARQEAQEEARREALSRFDKM